MSGLRSGAWARSLTKSGRALPALFLPSVRIGSVGRASGLLWRHPPERKPEPGMANLVLRRQFTVEWGHCDPAGIVFNSRFFEYFDWSVWRLFEEALEVKPNHLSIAFG